MNKESYKTFIYKGKLSKQYLSNPSEGVIVEIDNKKTIVFVGRFAPQKRPIEFVKLAEKYPSINFLMIGDGELSIDIDNYKNLLMEHLDYIPSDKFHVGKITHRIGSQVSFSKESVRFECKIKIDVL
jgi:glycosyltransferase involved in cell wall biosynthesis